MCSLFGLIDYKNSLTAREKNRIISVLSRECEVRGTDATGIAYNSSGKMRIYKKPVAAHKMWYRIPYDANTIMGHTRMTTQGSEKLNYNNHPFEGSIDGNKFALAHNGVLHNDIQLRRTENLPFTEIQTDSYIAVQLIEKCKALSFESVRSMAEKVEGSFCFTILNSNNDIYFVKGDNPLAIYHFNGFYLYASTDEILKSTLKKLKITESYSEIDIDCGEILRMNCLGFIQKTEFDFISRYHNFYNMYQWEDISTGLRRNDETVLDELIEYAGFFGINPEDIMMLYDFGYEDYEIEELMYNPSEFRECMEYLKMSDTPVLCDMMCT